MRPLNEKEPATQENEEVTSMEVTISQYNKQRRELVQQYPDGKFRLEVTSPGSEPVVIPSLALPKNIGPGLHRVRVYLMRQGKEPQVIYDCTLSVPHTDQLQPAHSETEDPQPITTDDLIRQIQTIESYRYNQMKQADKILADAQFEAIRLYHEAKDKQYQDWIERLQREREELRREEEEKRKRDLEWSEKLHAQQLEIERLRAGQPAQTGLPVEIQTMIAEQATQLFGVLTQLGIAVAAKKYGLQVNPPVDNPPPPPPEE